jgi:site-specific recombinase XerD
MNEDFARIVLMGVKDVTPHSLRHSFCKNLVNAGVSLEKIAALAGPIPTFVSPAAK